VGKTARPVIAQVVPVDSAVEVEEAVAAIAADLAPAAAVAAQVAVAAIVADLAPADPEVALVVARADVATAIYLAAKCALSAWTA
jgi:hypothetical protein